MTHEGQTGVYFQSGGFRLLGTLFKPAEGERRPTAIILHGIPGIEKNFDLAHTLRDHGWCSLIFHYRGCWGSEGAYTLRTIPEDVRAAQDFLSTGEHVEVDPQRLALVGHSLGGWAAVLAAAADERARAVAVYGAVTDPRTLPLSPRAAKAEFTPWLQGISPETLAEQWAELGADFVPVEQVGRLAPRPLLVIHGEQDTSIPLSQSEALYERAGGPREKLIVPEANHAFSWHRPILRGQILNWLTNAIGQA